MLATKLLALGRRALARQPVGLGQCACTIARRQRGRQGARGRHGRVRTLAAGVGVEPGRRGHFIAFQTVLWRGSRSAPSGDEVDDRHAHLDLLVPSAQDEDELVSLVHHASNLRIR